MEEPDKHDESVKKGKRRVSGRHRNDHQTRLYITYRQNDSVTVAAAKASLSRSSGYRIEDDPTLPSQSSKPRGSRRPDPLAGIFDEEVVPILNNTPDIRPIAVFDLLLRNHLLLGPGVRRTLERRKQTWRLQHGVASGDIAVCFARCASERCPAHGNRRRSRRALP